MENIVFLLLVLWFVLQFITATKLFSSRLLRTLGLVSAWSMFVPKKIRPNNHLMKLTLQYRILHDNEIIQDWQDFKFPYASRPHYNIFWQPQAYTWVMLNFWIQSFHNGEERSRLKLLAYLEATQLLPSHCTGEIRTQGVADEKDE